jgi:lipid-A-disaccharide synthase-like uncharacterized protein
LSKGTKNAKEKKPCIVEWYNKKTSSAPGNVKLLPCGGGNFSMTFVLQLYKLSYSLTLFPFVFVFFSVVVGVINIVFSLTIARAHTHPPAHSLKHAQLMHDQLRHTFTVYKNNS